MVLLWMVLLDVKWYFASDGKNQGKNSNRVFPIMIWLDPNYYPVTE